MLSINHLTLTIFNNPIDVVKTILQKRIESWRPQYSIIEHHDKETCFQLYEQHYNVTEDVISLFEPKSTPNTCVMYTNIEDGWGAMVASLCSQNDLLEAYHIKIYDKSKQYYPNYQLHYFSRNYKRVVLCYMDYPERWVFYEEGKPLPIEHVDLYSNRIKKKRFNGDILLSCLNRAGWDLTSPRFWQPHLQTTYEFMLTC